MKELLLEIFGWLGYLERPAVLVQLALTLSLMLTTHLAQQRCWLPRVPPLYYPPLGMATLILAGVILALRVR